MQFLNIALITIVILAFIILAPAIVVTISALVLVLVIAGYLMMLGALFLDWISPLKKADAGLAAAAA